MRFNTDLYRGGRGDREGLSGTGPSPCATCSGAGGGGVGEGRLGLGIGRRAGGEKGG